MEEYDDFMDAQIHRIEIAKWVQGERQHSDPGNEFVLDWVYHNAKKFRDDWHISLCKDCDNHRDCGWHAISACDGYSERE